MSHSPINPSQPIDPQFVADRTRDRLYHYHVKGETNVVNSRIEDDEPLLNPDNPSIQGELTGLALQLKWLEELVTQLNDALHLVLPPDWTEQVRHTDTEDNQTPHSPLVNQTRRLQDRVVLIRQEINGILCNLEL